MKSQLKAKNVDAQNPYFLNFLVLKHGLAYTHLCTVGSTAPVYPSDQKLYDGAVGMDLIESFHGIFSHYKVTLLS